MSETTTSGRFDVMALAAALPADAKAMIVDHYIADRATASARVFRVLKPVPAHFHETCDEFLYVLSGRARFWLGDPADEAEVGPGQLLVFDRRTVHAIPRLLEEPFTVLSIDTPRRAPTDITFVDPKDGTAADFMARNAEGE